MKSRADMKWVTKEMKEKEIYSFFFSYKQKSDDALIDICDIEGRVLLHKPMGEFTGFDFEGLPAGVYIVHIIDGDVNHQFRLRLS